MQLLKKVLNISAERHLKTAGDLFIYHSDYNGALQLVEKALELDAEDTRALVLLGDVLFCLNRDGDALHALEKALVIDSELPEAYISKASVLEVMGRFREALECCRQALAYVLKSKKTYLLPSLFEQEIVLLVRMKRFRQARQVLDKASLYIDEETDSEYLYASYKGLLDMHCQKRHQAQERAKELSLTLIQGKA